MLRSWAISCQSDYVTFISFHFIQFDLFQITSTVFKRSAEELVAILLTELLFNFYFLNVRERKLLQLLFMNSFAFLFSFASE